MKYFSYMKNNRKELAKIEAVFLEEHSVDECVLQICETNNVEQQIIDFVVSNGPFVPEYLQSKLATELLPLSNVPFSRLKKTCPKLWRTVAKGS
ncbi:MAG: hypothetical protein GY774_33595 [Planctomycetes bacterium]|nr:hypothetical protein [Planctomycetota bacterium]